MSTNAERTPMKPGEYTFYLADEKNISLRYMKKTDDFRNSVGVRVERLLSDRGVTCMVYEGTLVSNGRRVIIKEFYPCSEKNVWAINRNPQSNQTITIPSLTKNSSEIQIRFQQFLRSFQWQKEFNQNSKFLEIVVEPQYLAIYGNTYYIISDYHNGESLSQKTAQFETLEKKIYLFQYLADIMSIFEENKYLYLDICEDNYLIINQTPTKYQVRLFDMDSVINMEEIEQLHTVEGNVFFHDRYAAPELIQMGRMLETKSFDHLKKSYLENSLMVYSLGILYFKHLFDKMPEKEEIEKVRQEDAALAKELADKYHVSGRMAEKLLHILKMMLSERMDRHNFQCSSCKKVLSHLEKFAKEMTYDAYLSQKKITEANGTFAAYHMLQKFPLYHYLDKNGGTLNIVLAGKHVMRDGFLSAVLSIGQMLHAIPDISIVAEDAADFWADYTSKEKNAALKGAVEVYSDREAADIATDFELVERPLAKVRLISGDPKRKISRLCQEGNRYFILLDQEDAVKCWYQKLCETATEPVFAACLWGDGEFREKQTDLVTRHLISSLNFSELYHEGMYQEKIYQMGLMAHLYYCGITMDCPEERVRELRSEYQKDIYSQLSSERAALHSMYKMASLLEHPDRPGRTRKYFELLGDEKNVEILGWLEHLSWTAYMLTTGHEPIDVETMDEYAYQGSNDWKYREESGKIRHPLLVASKKEKKLPENGWEKLTESEATKLDSLDRVSYQIYQWYCGQKEPAREQLLAWIQENKGDEHAALWSAVKSSGLECIEHVGEKQTNQETVYVKSWKDSLYQLRMAEPNLSTEKIQRVMRPILDSYRCRDFKQFDRALVYSVPDFC